MRLKDPNEWQLLKKKSFAQQEKIYFSIKMWAFDPDVNTLQHNQKTLHKNTCSQINGYDPYLSYSTMVT